jgi:hypothetical protein
MWGTSSDTKRAGPIIPFIGLVAAAVMMGTWNCTRSIITTWVSKVPQ